MRIVDVSERFMRSVLLRNRADLSEKLSAAADVGDQEKSRHALRVAAGMIARSLSGDKRSQANRLADIGSWAPRETV